MSEADPAAERLHAVFESHARRVFAYALRHVDPATAHDVVSDVFLVVWRRIGDVPDDPLPWLLVIARNVVANSRRGRQRRQRLDNEVGVATRLAAVARSAEDAAVDRVGLLDALAGLPPAEREALLLVAWDNLTAAQAARVAGCSTHAFEVRLHRARARVERILAADTSPSPERSAR